MEEKSYIEILEEIIKGAEVVDLSYALQEYMPAWPTQARFGSVIYESYDYGGAALHSMITMSEHTGTHIDAPKHFVKGGRAIDELALTSVMGRGVHIDALKIAEKGLLGSDAFRAFEKEHGEIKKGDIVMIRFGWDKKYRLQPDANEYLTNWPGLSKEAAEYLAEREIGALGCDTLSIDAYGTRDYSAHHVLLGRGIPVIENIVNLEKLPAFSYVIGLPNKFKDGSGSPIRLIALVTIGGNTGL